MSRISHVLLLHLFRLSDSSYIFIIMMAQLTIGLLFRFRYCLCIRRRKFGCCASERQRECKSLKEREKNVSVFILSPMKNVCVSVFVCRLLFGAGYICHIPSLNKCKHRSYKYTHIRTHAHAFK